MIKRILSILILICIATFFTINVSAESHSWSMKRVAGDCPIFPDKSEFALKHSCFGFDRTAYKNGEKILYLTFDSGYENGNTEKILNTLKEKNVHATFFILKHMVEKESELVSRMIEEGHTVANHTKNHKDLTGLTNEEIARNLATLEAMTKDNFGYAMPKFFRYPEGKYDERTVLCLEELGYKTFFWSLAYADWDNNRQPSSAFAKETLLNYTHPGAIVLLHPTSATNAEILGDMICKWQEMGYTFGTLEDLVKKNEGS